MINSTNLNPPSSMSLQRVTAASSTNGNGQPYMELPQEAQAFLLNMLGPSQPTAADNSTSNVVQADQDPSMVAFDPSQASQHRHMHMHTHMMGTTSRNASTSAPVNPGCVGLMTQNSNHEHRLLEAPGVGTSTGSWMNNMSARTEAVMPLLNNLNCQTSMPLVPSAASSVGNLSLPAPTNACTMTFPKDNVTFASQQRSLQNVLSTPWQQPLPLAHKLVDQPLQLWQQDLNGAPHSPQDIQLVASLNTVASAASAPPQVALPKIQWKGRGRSSTFPLKLHQMLLDLEKQEGGPSIASFLPHGRGFQIHKPKEFAKHVMPNYFRMSTYSSFQRQLNLYDFQRIADGPEKGAYWHEFFLRDNPMLSTNMKRSKVKGATRAKQDLRLRNYEQQKDWAGA